MEEKLEALASTRGLQGLSSSALSKCSNFCFLLDLEPSEIIQYLEAFLLNNHKETLSIELYGKFEQYLLKQPKKKRPLEDKSIPTESKSPRVISIPSSNHYSTRTQSGQTVGIIWNDSQPQRGRFEKSTNEKGFRCVIKSSSDDFDNITQSYRYMFTTLDERARSLEHHLHSLQQQLIQHIGLEETSIQAIGVPSPDTVWVCGRICCDSDGRINDASIQLQGSLRESGGRQISLDVSGLESYSLFPGQIIFVEGVNSSGRKMVAKRIVDGIPRPLPKSKPNELKKLHHTRQFQDGKSLEIFVAAGPFTVSDNLSYEPLRDLFMKVLEEKPDVVILIGPFVDVNQPLIQSGDIKLEDFDENGNEINREHSATFEMVFTEKILRDSFQMYFNSEEDYGELLTQFILVPSLNDAFHDFVFPQPPFMDREGIKTEFFQEELGVLNIPLSRPDDPSRRIHLVSNPSMFRINEILFGVTSLDVLFSLSTDDATKVPDRINTLVGHLLKQQSFCPQFPVPQATTAPLDFKFARNWQFSTHSPDILLLPSKHAHFTKNVLGTLAINPGTLSKGTYGGTFAKISIPPLDQSTLTDAIIGCERKGQLIPPQEVLPHSASERSRVQILKI